MKQLKTPLILALCGSFALSACTNPSSIGTNGPNNNQKAKNGAAVGALTGAVLGAIVSSKEDREKGILEGAILGGAVGAGVGHNLDKQAEDLRRDLNNSDVSIENTGDRLVVTLPQDILFATDSVTVRSDLRRDLQTVAGNLQAYPNSTIQVIGHTDSDGDAAYNQRLSEGRSTSVANVLMGAGIAPSRIQAIGRGESQPVASNLDAAGKAQNRRVEIIILPNT